MSFKNKGRLPFYLAKPQYPAKEEIYVKSNGLRRVNSRTISKQLEGRTDWMPAEWHEALMIALRHDYVLLQSTNFEGYFSIEGDYEIEWPDFMNLRVAPAKFKGFENGFAAQQDQCGTCDDVTYGAVDNTDLELHAGDDTVVDVGLNDSVCCGTAEFNIISYDNVLLELADFEDPALGGLHLIVRDNAATTVDALLATYTLTCNGEQTTAEVRGNITGAACPSIGFVTPAEVSGNSITFYWVNPGTYPALGIVLELFKLIGSTYVLQTTTAINDDSIEEYTYNSLEYGATYKHRIRAKCSATEFGPEFLESKSIGAPGGFGADLIVYLSLIDNPIGINSRWSVQAEVQSPSVDVSANLVIDFILQVNGVDYPDSVTIASGTNIGTSGLVAVDDSAYPAAITSAAATPTPIYCSDSQTHPVILQY